MPSKDSFEFAGNHISSFGLILNKNGARDQKIILMKKFNFFLEI
jgi:hypothetical protein